MQREGETDLLLGADISAEARLSPIQSAPEESPWKDRRRVLGQSEFVQGECSARCGTWRGTIPHAKGERIEQGEGPSGMEGDDEVQRGASEGIQEEISQEEQRRIYKLILQGEVRRIPLQQEVAYAEEGSRPEGHNLQHQTADTVQNQTRTKDMGLSLVD